MKPNFIRKRQRERKIATLKKVCVTSSNTKNTLADKIKLLAQISIEGCGKTYMIRGKNT